MPPANCPADAANDRRPDSVNENISDLFFSHDLEHCRVLEQGVFVGWNDEKLRDEAALTLGCLERLGVPTPTVDALVADFLSRC